LVGFFVFPQLANNSPSLFKTYERNSKGCNLPKLCSSNQRVQKHISMAKLTHDQKDHQYTLHLENGEEAYVSYVLEGKMMKLTYSYVPPELRGSGVANRHPKWSMIID
jgi:hypothetical protein